MHITTHRGTITSQNDLFLGYLCEGCGEPITVTLTIEGSISGSALGLAISGVKEGDAARKRAEKEKVFLEYLKAPNTKELWEFRAESIAGFKAECPFCGHANVWQPPSLYNEQTGETECYVFESLSDCRDWAVGFLYRRKIDAAAAWADRKKMAEYDYAIENDKLIISRLEQEKKLSPEAQTLAVLEKQDKMLEEGIQNTSVFSKERTMLVKQKENVQGELTNARKANKDVVEKKDNQIRLLRRHMILLEKKKKIYAGFAVRRETENCLAYRLAEPGDNDGEKIPLVLLPQIVNIRLSDLVRENRERIEAELGLAHSGEE